MRFFVWLFVGVLLFAGGVLLLQGTINTNHVRNQIVAAIKDRTGQDVQIKGGVMVRLLPRPVVYAYGLEITNPDSKHYDPELSADQVNIGVSLASLIDQKPQVTSIVLKRPIFTMQKTAGDKVNWGWLNPAFLKDHIASSSAATPLRFSVVDGRAIYIDVEEDDRSSVESIFMDAYTGEALSASGEMTVAGRNLQFEVDDVAGTTPVKAGLTPLNVKLYSDDSNTISLTGGYNLTGDTPVVEGALDVESNNLRAWLGKPKSNDAQAGQPEMEDAPLPVKLTANWTQQGAYIELKDAQLQGLNSAGQGIIGISWADAAPSLQIDMNMKALDYNKWSELFANIIEMRSQNPQRRMVVDDSRPHNPLPEKFHMMLYLDVDNLIWGQQTLNHTKIQAALSDGAFTVNQFNVEMPGESVLNLFGVISPGSTGGLRFEGSMEMQGKSLRKALTLVDEASVTLPEAGFGEFFSRANVFISAEQMRLSEAEVKINQLELYGGLVAYFEGRPRIEADVRLRDINFDYFRDIWRQENKNPRPGDYFLKFDRNLNLNWLRKLRASVDFRVNVEGFTLFERKGSEASFRLFSKDAEFGLYNMRFAYPADEITANILLSARSDVPTLNLVLNTVEMDTAYFLPTGVKTDELEEVKLKPTWSEDIVDVSWLDGIAATLDITIGKLKHKDNMFDELKFQGRVENSSLVFKNTSFGYWDGKVNLSGLLYGGKVPGINMSYTLYNVQLAQFAKDVLYRDNITGRLSITGTANTSGVNYTSWLSQAEVNTQITGRGINVKGINLPGVVQAVKVSRTAADVFNNANLALTKGSTEFAVDGTINIKNAVAKTPGIALKSDVANGRLSGELKLMPWRIDSSLLFNFHALSNEAPPPMVVQVAGALEDPQLRTDTSSLEAYVAKQIIGR